MAEIIEKKYLDYTGLSHYDEKIKELIKSGDSQVLVDAKAYVDERIGTLDESYANVAAAIVGEATRAAGAEEAIQNELDALKEVVGAPAVEGDEDAGVDAKPASGLFEKVETLEAALGEDGSVADQIDGAIEALDLENTYAGKAYEAKVDTLIGEDEGKSAREIAAAVIAKALIPENAQESLDTLEEIAAWIQAHPEDAAAMNKAIEDLQKEVGAPKGETKVTILEGKALYDADGNQVEAKDVDPNAIYYVDDKQSAPAVVGEDYLIEESAPTGLYKAIDDLDRTTDARLDAVEIALGMKGEGEEGDQSIAEKVADLETDVAALKAVSYVAITNDEIDALFAPAEEEEPTV